MLGSSTVTNTGPTILTGNRGAQVARSPAFSALLQMDGPGVFSGSAHQADAIAGTAQTQLGLAMTSLELMGTGHGTRCESGWTHPRSRCLPFLSTAQLTGTLTLDGLGNANAFWVFEIPSTLTTASGSTVNIVNTGADAGVFWNVGSSATLGSTTSFEGNILAEHKHHLGQRRNHGLRWCLCAYGCSCHGYQFRVHRLQGRPYGCGTG